MNIFRAQTAMQPDSARHRLATDLPSRRYALGEGGARESLYEHLLLRECALPVLARADRLHKIDWTDNLHSSPVARLYVRPSGVSWEISKLFAQVYIATLGIPLRGLGPAPGPL
jgi:hypothetical protein